MKLQTKFVLTFLAVSVIPIGLVIGLSLWAVHNNHTDSLTGSLVSVGFILIILVVFFALQFAKYITDPIIKVAQTAAKLSRGHFSERVSFQSGDEIGELAQRFNEMADQIEHIDSIKSDFINLASHHLRTPQTIITGSVEELLSKQHSGLSQEQTMYLELIRKGSLELHDVAETLLTVSSVQLGHAQPHLTNLQLRGLLREVVDQFQKDAQTQHVELMVEDGEVIRLESDAQLLRVALRSLVRNALLFTEQGSVRLSAYETDDEVTIRVTDTGIGIPAEELPEIFTKFFQAKNGKKMYPNGQGLGLYLASTCVETLGGRATVSSELGKGSTFSLVLPKA